MVKKKPIDSTAAEFWKVVGIPPPAPRWFAGRLFMTALVLGAANRPMDSPISRQQREQRVREVRRQGLEAHRLRPVPRPEVAKGRGP